MEYPQVARAGGQPVKQLNPGESRAILAYGPELMFAEVYFETGVISALHSHPHTQITYVLEGEFVFTVGGADGEKVPVKQGDSIYNAPGVPHFCECVKKGVLLDTFSPMRADFV